MITAQDKFDLWCMVELFGHQKIAGRCTEQNIAGTNMLRVDVPETDTQPAFTRFFGSSAIYAINPMDEETVKALAARLQVAPIDSYNFSEILKKRLEQMPVPALLRQNDGNTNEMNRDREEYNEW